MTERTNEAVISHGVKAADVVRVAGLIGDERNGRIGGVEMLRQIRVYYEADIREQVAREIETAAASGVHAYEEPVFVDAAYVARHGSLTPPAHPNPEPPTGDGGREGVSRRG